MPSPSRVDAQHVKEKGNVAFKSGDYVLARSLYTHAIRFDAASYVYPLNRSMANLKLEKWENAILDSDKVLELSPFNLTALFVRLRARKELGYWIDARQDIQTFIENGGDPQKAVRELEALTNAQNNMPLPSPTSELGDAIAALTIEDSDQVKYDPSASFVVRKSATIPNGVGAYATRPIRRGEMISSETPTFTIPQNLPERLKSLAIESKVLLLSPGDLDQYLSLHNSHEDCGCSLAKSLILGIYATNAFTLTDDAEGGVCMKTSRFNHSCAPNARYYFDERKNEMKVFVLTDIQEGEEIFVMYIMGRGVYGTPGFRRRAVLRQQYHFICACKVCSLPADEARISDARRKKLAALWDVIPMFTPMQGYKRLQVIIEAVRLMKEEGYHADADDYTNDAGVVCAFHSDWESAKYWVGVTYQTRVEEFGEDSPRADEARRFLDPKTMPLAGRGPLQLFTTLRL